MQLKLFMLPPGDRRAILNRLFSKYGLPSTRRDLAVYLSSEKKGEEIHIRFRNKKCLVRYVGINQHQSENPRFHIATSTTNIKEVFLYFKDLGFHQASIGSATSYSFYSSPTLFLDLMKGTFVGDFIQLGFVNIEKAQPIINFLNQLGLTEHNIKGDDSQIVLDTVPIEDTIDKLGVLNSKIYEYCQEVGLHIDLFDRTLKAHIDNFSNDYSHMQTAYHFLTQHDLLSKEPLSQDFVKYFKPFSIIIPSFNSHKTLVKTLQSIQSQSLPLDLLSQVQVIIVDDGSKDRASTYLKKNAGKYDFKFEIVRLELNKGLSFARNAGLSQAMNDMVLFLDSDMLLPKNYLLEHSIRCQIIPNAVFVSMKKNIEPTNEITDIDTIAQGLQPNDLPDDMRLRKIIPSGAIGINKVNSDQVVEVLSSTNYFKSLSYGRSVGIYDLPAMVVGHNFTCLRRKINHIAAFSTEFKGWGLEDSFFGAEMIAKGNFVIPVLSSGVYHINHPPRSGSNAVKQKELHRNFKKYNSLLKGYYSSES